MEKYEIEELRDEAQEALDECIRKFRKLSRELRKSNLNRASGYLEAYGLGHLENTVSQALENINSDIEDFDSF